MKKKDRAGNREEIRRRPRVASIVGLSTGAVSNGNGRLPGRGLFCYTRVVANEEPLCRRRLRETVIQNLEHFYCDRVLSTQWLSNNPVFRESL
jgi:hypothetical protein